MKKCRKYMKKYRKKLPEKQWNNCNMSKKMVLYKIDMMNEKNFVEIFCFSADTG